MCNKKEFREDKRFTGFFFFLGMAFLYLLRPKDATEVLNETFYGERSGSINNQELN